MTQLTDSDPDLGELVALDSDEERRLSTLLRSAYAPTEISPARHERLLQAALEDPFAPASADELVESERLRQALDGNGDGDHLDLVLARALSAAHAPSREAPRALPRLARGAPERPPAKVLYYRFAGVAATLAAAAAVLLAITTHTTHTSQQASLPELPALALAQSRSTAALIQADAAGDPSTRIDRIASLRGRELRDNRYALWGVR
jgi:hypothetical protein